MPSHFAHLLFAEDALRGALGEKANEILDTHGNLFRFGAQGPDFFYHNQRTMPTGLRYGVALHRHGYGSFVRELVREAVRLSAGPSSELSAFILGFTTHAPLDRLTHPFIGYFAGWVDPKEEASRRMYHAHPFLERILDVLVLRERYGMLPAQFDFLNKVRCGATLPYPVIKAMVKGLNTIYPAYNYKSRNRQRIENAYHDAIFFYKLTNHLNPDIIKLAYRKDRNEGFREKRLGLLHPREVPAGYDFLNLSHQSWCHPCDSAAVMDASFVSTPPTRFQISNVMLMVIDHWVIGNVPGQEAINSLGGLPVSVHVPLNGAYSPPKPLTTSVQEPASCDVGGV